MRFIKQYIEKILNNQQGSALAYVLIMFSVIFILSSSALAIFSSNLKQTKNQQYRMEAYYLSYSGALMGYSAIIADGNQVLNQIISGAVKEEKNISLTDDVKGTVDIIAKQTSHPNYSDWIEIVAISTLTDEKVSTKTILYVNPTDPSTIVWNAH